MRKNILTISLIILTNLILTSNGFSTTFKGGAGTKIKAHFNLENLEREIFSLINRERRQRNLNELKWRGDVAKMARKYSEKMARERFFSHFERNGAGVAERARDAKIKNWLKIGENLFYYEDQNTSSSFVVKKWMQSSTHRANILDRRYNAAGLGIAQSPDGRFYITQVFVEE